MMTMRRRPRAKTLAFGPSTSPPRSRPSQLALPKSQTVPSLLQRPLPFHNAQEKAAISPRHQPSPLNHRVLRNVALHALLKAARFVPLADASLLVLQAVPSGLLPPTLLLRHQFQRAMESTASWVLLQQHWPVLLEDAFTLIPQ